jgi:hypothetical protein
MNRFNEALVELGDRLAIPQPARSRVLLEIAADMEDLYLAFITEGLPEDEARRRTLEQFGPSEEALRDLVAVHSTPVKRALDGLSEQARSRWERGLLAALVVFAMVVGGRSLLAGRMLSGMSLFAWPILLFVVAGLLIGAMRIYSIFIKKDHDIRRLRSGLSPLLVLAVAELVLGFGGAWVGLFLAIVKMMDDIEHSGVYLFGWMLRGSATLCFGMIAAMLLALIWMVLAARVAAIEQAEAAVLLRPRTSKPQQAVE